MSRRKPKFPNHVYVHMLDTTEGIQGNKPLITMSKSRANPFGRPGVDYSESYPWTYRKYTPAKETP